MLFIKPDKVGKEGNTRVTDTSVPASVRARAQTPEPTPQGQCSCFLLWMGNLVQEGVQKLSLRFSL